jgi:hypothetical protein
MQLESMIELIIYVILFMLKLTCRNFLILVHLFTNLRLDSRDSMEEVPNPGGRESYQYSSPSGHTRNVPCLDQRQ